MFLSKKTATTFNKPKTIDTNKAKRMLGGWNDDEEEKSQPLPKQQIQTNNKPSINLLDNTTADIITHNEPIVTNTVNQTIKREYFDWDALNERTDINIQKGIVQEIIKPAGIRIKQSDSALNDFLKEAKFLETSVIGSLLLSKIEVNYPFQIKAKALYAIEYLVKKNEEYLKFFKAHADKLREFPEPQDNVENYHKICKMLMNVIGVSAPSDNEQKPQFLDPGYASEPVDAHPKSGISDFIHENANKAKKGEAGKTLVGPGGQSKAKAEVKVKAEVKKQTNLLEFDFAPQSAQNDISLV